MEKSNEPSAEKTWTISNDILKKIGRRLEVSKAFFIWVATIYFLSTLFAIGGLWTVIFSPIAKGMIGILLFATAALLYSLYAYSAAIAWGFWYRIRYGFLAVLACVFISSLLRNFWVF